MMYFEGSYVIISQTMTDMQKGNMYCYQIESFSLAYLHLTLTDSKGKGQDKVMHVATETGHYSSVFAKCFLEL